MIDANVTLGRSPFRSLPLEEPPVLMARLKQLGITSAWAASFDALLHEDVDEVNRRLRDECQGLGGFFVPIGSINPLLPDWEEDLRRCRDVYKMPGIRLHPEFHSYGPTDSALNDLLVKATTLGLFVQLCWRFEDERTVHRALKLSTWKPSDVGPLIEMIRPIRRLRLMFLNAQSDLRNEGLARLVKTGVTTIDIARQEGVEGVRRLVDLVGADRVIFGSHSPFFTPESSVLKLKESVLNEAETRAIQVANAQRILTSSPG